MLARALLGTVVVLEATAAAERFARRRATYAAAVARARATGRPLVVVGDPDAGLHTGLRRAYGCGDVCVDLRGCPGCPRSIAADLTRGPVPGLADGSAVVFLSCVLEYCADAPAALAEARRIAGDPANLFVVPVGGGHVTRLLYPGARWHVGADGTPRPIAPTARVVAAAGLVTLAALAW